MHDSRLSRIPAQASQYYTLALNSRQNTIFCAACAESQSPQGTAVTAGNSPRTAAPHSLRRSQPGDGRRGLGSAGPRGSVSEAAGNTAHPTRAPPYTDGQRMAGGGGIPALAQPQGQVSGSAAAGAYRGPRPRAPRALPRRPPPRPRRRQPAPGPREPAACPGPGRPSRRPLGPRAGARRPRTCALAPDPMWALHPMQTRPASNRRSPIRACAHAAGSQLAAPTKIGPGPPGPASP